MDQKTKERAIAATKDLLAADPDRDYLLISHQISRELHYNLSRLLAKKAQHRKCTVFLTTYGGDPDGGFRIARCLRHYYKEHLRIAVPSWCKSAGTLIAFAADELAIGDFGELGPLDIQVHKGTELQERSSGLDISEALGAVTAQIKMAFHQILRETRGMGLSTRLSAEFASQVSSAIAAPLYSQIDPLRLGELNRAMRIAYEYGEKLNKYSNNLKDGALESLIQSYPSHSFVIDRKEAKELFHRVFSLSKAENEFAEAFWSIALQDQENVPPTFIRLPPSNDANGDDNEATDGSPPDGPSDQVGAAGDDATERADDPEPSEEGVRVRPASQEASTDLSIFG